MKHWMYECDKCQKPINGKRYVLWLYDTEDSQGGTEKDGQHEQKFDFDLCEDCARKIMKFICDPEEEGTSQLKDSEQEIIRKPGPKKIDRGKALALKNAGWTYKMIAEEMNLTEKQVQNAIYQERKKTE